MSLIKGLKDISSTYIATYALMVLSGSRDVFGDSELCGVFTFSNIFKRKTDISYPALTNIGRVKGLV